MARILRQAARIAVLSTDCVIWIFSDTEVFGEICYCTCVIWMKCRFLSDVILDGTFFTDACMLKIRKDKLFSLLRYDKAQGLTIYS